MPLRVVRLALAPVLAAALLSATAGAALGRDESVPEAKGSAARTPVGYDISYPQCGGTYPRDVAFGIVGVTEGIVFSANPCLGAGGDGESQLAWAGPEAELYMNTGNPGPELSSYWPIGQMVPRVCSPDDPDTADCAYDYGWNAASDAYAVAVDAYISLGWADATATRTPVPNHWWLDVETANSWRDDPSLNVAALQGAVAYLESMEVASVGFYSVGPMWDAITGGTDAFAAYPSWVAGASTLRGAKAVCRDASLTGGPVELAQYIARGFDADYRCSSS
ncbi:MAG TPA: hypothetical protein VF013_04955 [Candidatus Limnocylindria bacterium]